MQAVTEMEKKLVSLTLCKLSLTADVKLLDAADICQVFLSWPFTLLLEKIKTTHSIQNNAVVYTKHSELPFSTRFLKERMFKYC